MDRNIELYEYVKRSVLNFKFDRCCCVAPIRIGLLVTGYFNMFMALLFILDESGILMPPLKAAQATINEEEISKPLCILAYSTEVAFNTLLLCGIYRNDIVLLRVYIYFLMASIISSVLVYSIVFAVMSALIQILIVCNWVFQCYVIVLVRSVIVEIKESQSSEKNGQVTLYSVVRMPDELPTETKDNHDVEAAVESDDSDESEDSKDETPHPEQKKDEPPTKLETVHENTKENVV